jgi:hypothetical protein
MKYYEKFSSRINPNLNDFLQEFFHASRIREVSAAALWLFQLCPILLEEKFLCTSFTQTFLNTDHHKPSCKFVATKSKQ